MTARRRTARLLVASALVVLAACGGGGAGTALPVQPGSSGMKPEANGFSFPNFPSSAYSIQFDEKDLVGMFGSGDTVCVDAVADPCVPTAEAAAFARMVNQARATGHCEGLVTVALSRFDAKEQPSTVALPAEGETLDVIMRAFATQFIPEVQDDADKWAAKSLKDKLSALAESFASGNLSYTLGVYVEEGGHALLPYAVDFPSKDLARIKVYDSNWPAKDRFVDVDLKTDTWKFAFSGQDPANDPAAWTGGPGDIDLTGIDKRQGSCPFCGDGTKVLKNTLLLRTDNLDWSVDVNGKTVTPQTPDAAAEDGVTVKPVKGAGDRNAYDYVIQVPVDTAGSSGSSAKTSVKFTGPASMFALTPGGIAQVETPGTSGLPVEVGNNSVESKDPEVNLTLAAGTLVASATGGQSSLEVKGESLAVTVQTGSGQVVEQQVTPQAPAARVVADADAGTVTVLSQTAGGPVVKREVAADGTETKSTTKDESLNLSTTEYQAPKGLESKAVETLPQLKDRDLTNTDYRSEVGKAADEVVAAQKATVGTFEIADHTFGDSPFVVQPPASDSTGAFVFASSNEEVASVSAAGRVTLNGAGSVFIHATQAGTDRFLPSTTTATLRVAKARANPASVASITKKFGDEPFALPAVTSASPAPFTWESTDTKVLRIVAGKVTVVGAGSAVLVATQPATDRYEATERRVTVTVARRSTTFAAMAPVTKTFGDAEFTLSPPASPSAGAWTFASSEPDVLAVNQQTGTATVKAAGSAVVTMSQAGTVNDDAASVTVGVTVAKAKPAIGSVGFAARTFGVSAASFAATAPTSTSSGSFTWSSGDTAVATVNATTGVVTVVHAGTVTITATQSATQNHESASASGVLTVNKGSQGAFSISGSTGFVGANFVPAVNGGLGSGAVTFVLAAAAAGGAGCVSHGSYVTASGAGTCVIVATKAGDVDYLPATSASLAVTFIALSPGVKVTEYSFYDEWVASNYSNPIPDLNVARTAVGTTTMSEIYAEWVYAPDPFSLWDFFIVQFDGYVTAPTTGNVRFRIGWDDGVKLILDGTTVAENWAISCCSVADSADIAFTAGVPRPFRLWYFDAQYNAAVKMEWSLDGGQTWVNVPASALSYSP